MENQDRRVLCLENSELAAYLLSKRQELADKPKGITENVDATLSKAYSNICNSKTHIQTLKDLSQVKYAFFLSLHFHESFDLEIAFSFSVSKLRIWGFIYLFIFCVGKLRIVVVVMCTHSWEFVLGFLGKFWYWNSVCISCWKTVFWV